jgi:uncharacterized repeat protein (TIGR01451 family)
LAGLAITVGLAGVLFLAPGVARAAPGQLQIFKTPDASSVNAGDQIGFTIKVVNVSPHPQNAVVSDALPTNAGTSWSISPAKPSCTISSGTLACFVRGLAPGSVFSVHIVSPTTTATCGTVTNAATVNWPGGNATSAPATITVNCGQPDLVVDSIAFTAPSNYPPYSYTVTVKNQGTATADLSGVAVQGYYSASAGVYPGDQPACGSSFNSGTTLAPGATATIAVGCSQPSSTPGDGWLVVKVDSSDKVVESDETNNVGSVSLFDASLTDDGACEFTVNAEWHNVLVDTVIGIWFYDGAPRLTSAAPVGGGSGSVQFQAGPFVPSPELHDWQVEAQFYYLGAQMGKVDTNHDIVGCALP